MATTAEWDYNIEDAQDDTGVDDNNVVGSEEEIWQYINRQYPPGKFGFRLVRQRDGNVV